MTGHDIRLVLGFDFGTRSIGIAVGQMITGQARELCNLKAENGIPKWEEIEKLIKEWKPDVLIVGKPLNMDGSESPLCARTKKFANRLNGRFNLPAYEHDERLTTFEAKGERMAQGGQRGSFRDNPVDAIAARLVLQSWIDEFLAKSQSKA